MVAEAGDGLKHEQAILPTIEIQEDNEDEPRCPYSGIIVFGHGYSNSVYRLSPEAGIRALAAYQLWKDGVAPRIILTGGAASESSKQKYGDDLQSNSETMRDFLIKFFRVPPESIVIEDKSIKTVDNVAHALNSLDGQGLPTDDFVTVSTSYHMERISDIMNKFGLKSAPVSAESALKSRSRQHADRTKVKESMLGLPEAEIERRYQYRLHRYDRFTEKLRLSDPVIVNELRDEPKWQEAMQQWGYWGPLALAVRGEKLREIVENNRPDIESWLARHPDIGVSLEDIIEGNFDYLELVNKGREVPK
jgi:uncharacterized SAM-binding protein YcdF (DUF218 family)